MNNYWKNTFAEAIKDVEHLLHQYGREVDTGHWQGVSTEGRPDMVTIEAMGVYFTCPMPLPKPEECAMEQPLFMLRDEIQPNLPWADEHFEERVGRRPTNPGEAYRNWPYWKGQGDATMENEKFTHTYQERFWPKKAGEDRRVFTREDEINCGIRYAYGDLDDLVKLLLNQPHTRQAYLPIFFPEDTGAVHGGRIPCTLGYQFLLRNDKLHMWYFIRSCDFIRHFRDDLYLSARLLLWVLDELQRWSARWQVVTPGNFTFVCPSLHYHRGDQHLFSS